MIRASFRFWSWQGLPPALPEFRVCFCPEQRELVIWHSGRGALLCNGSIFFAQNSVSWRHGILVEVHSCALVLDFTLSVTQTLTELKDFTD